MLPVGGAPANGGANGKPSVGVNYEDKMHYISRQMVMKRSVVEAGYQSRQHAFYGVISMIIRYRLFQG